MRPSFIQRRMATRNGYTASRTAARMNGLSNMASQVIKKAYHISKSEALRVGSVW